MIDREKVIKGLEICTSRPCYCTDCPYKANCYLDSQEVMEDALALLKEQRPHLLTLEEAEKTSCTWIEIKPNTIIGPRLIRIVPIDITACMVYTFGADMPTCYNTCDYNKTWRCWSVQPTLEEQLKEKWLDEDAGSRTL